MMQIIFTVLVTIPFWNSNKEFPSLDMPIVCDMSSDIFSRVLDFQSSISYMLAQKTWVLLELH
jgi:phosphoserine aminotransferase